jgi:hypothetical protein
MTMYNAAIKRLDMPARFLRLPVDKRGYPVPKFVAWIDGEADFRVVETGWIVQAVNHDLCWLCGDKLGRFKAFVIGPMCAVNRINSEPPSHLECARFAVKACPFMVNPERKRDTYTPYPEGGEPAAGIPLDRNPGVMLIWITKSYRPFRPSVGYKVSQVGNVLFALGDPTALEWWHRGRQATREEIMASINSGLPLLRKLAEEDGPAAIEEFNRQHARALELVPA